MISGRSHSATSLAVKMRAAAPADGRNWTPLARTNSTTRSLRPSSLRPLKRLTDSLAWICKRAPSGARSPTPRARAPNPPRSSQTRYSTSCVPLVSSSNHLPPSTLAKKVQPRSAELSGWATGRRSMRYERAATAAQVSSTPRALERAFERALRRAGSRSSSRTSDRGSKQYSSCTAWSVISVTRK